ncbi:MAG: serine dehydrogenasease [Planctomycetes bacterium]|nr:serine dehydrogenasease [Planctomycetota bacterium]
MSDPTEQIRVNKTVEKELDRLAQSIEQLLNADVLAIFGDFFDPLDVEVRDAVEQRRDKRNRVAVVVDTLGGVVEIVERLVTVIRKHYADVTMVVPDKAMSAGTVFVMSADTIMMDYFSCLGPIDPQIRRESRFIPAKSYLAQFEKLVKKSEDGTLTNAEAILLQKLDLGELHSFQQAEELSLSLLKEWLAKYKFKDWKVTESKGQRVTDEMRRARADQIATALMNQERWHSHSRPISMDVLIREVNLRIDDFGSDASKREAIRDYHRFLADYMGKLGALRVVHTSGRFGALPF